MEDREIQIILENMDRLIKQKDEYIKLLLLKINLLEENQLFKDEKNNVSSKQLSLKI